MHPTRDARKHSRDLFRAPDQTRLQRPSPAFRLVGSPGVAFLPEVPAPPPVIPIDDPEDSRIADYRSIRERDLVGRKGLFIAEGEVVVRILLRGSAHRPRSLLIAERRIAGLGSLLAAVPAGVPIYSARHNVLDEIAGFSMHRGILAIGKRAEAPSAGVLLDRLGKGALVVALFGIANHDNMGGIFRNAAAFGADAVVIDPTCCDPLYRKAIRVSVGAALIVPFARFDSGDDPLQVLGRSGYDAIALSPAGDFKLADIVRIGRMAVMLGAEGPGLPDALIAGARSVRIPMAPGFDSLNVATAAGIVLHHLTSR